MSPITSRIRESKYSALENYLIALKPELRQYALEYLASNGGTLDSRARAYRRFGRERVLAIHRRMAYPDVRNFAVVTARKNVGRVGMNHWLTFAVLVAIQRDHVVDAENIEAAREQLRRYARHGEFVPKHSSEPPITDGARVFRFKDPRPSLKPMAFFDREANRVIR
jgi:hypothetical protein